MDTERYGEAATKSLADLLTEVNIGTFIKVQKLHSCQFADTKIPFLPSPAFEFEYKPHKGMSSIQCVSLHGSQRDYCF